MHKAYVPAEARAPRTSIRPSPYCGRSSDAIITSHGPRPSPLAVCRPSQWHPSAPCRSTPQMERLRRIRALGALLRPLSLEAAQARGECTELMDVDRARAVGVKAIEKRRSLLRIRGEAQVSERRAERGPVDGACAIVLVHAEDAIDLVEGRGARRRQLGVWRYRRLGRGPRLGGRRLVVPGGGGRDGGGGGAPLAVSHALGAHVRHEP
mmetsp:Transcript_34544/g.90899  ORF Transcript_34544/g.90899 Transcript_34544/m.90899 type:complete len:209 (-) Transcript_34544:89-715(-)